MSEKHYKSELIGLFGSPVDENPTVITMEAGFKALGLNYRYCTMEVKPENLGTAVAALKALGFKGTNLTIPHKVAVIPHLDHLSEGAKLIGAVNTIYIKDGETHGENTDGKGFIIALKENGVSIEGKRITILGAGGAARAVAVELALEKAAHITIINVNKERGSTLSGLIREKTGVSSDYISWDHTCAIPPDTSILVQATSVGLFPDPNCPDIAYDTVRPPMVACDVVPNPPETLFIRKAKENGCKTLTGLPMLVNQAGIGFRLWTGREAPVDVMMEATLNEFSKS
ncbi:MAG: shikimate dehydrogenase [Treponema sp.]|nr:shikimate dehydrogenase [Treponema sp.]